MMTFSPSLQGFFNGRNSLLDRLNRSTIKHKMMTIYFVVNLSAMAIVFASVMLYEYYSFRYNLQQQALFQAENIANRVAEPLKLRQYEELSNTMFYLDLFPEILEVSILQPDQSLVASYQKKNLKSSSRLTRSNIKHWNRYIIRHPITADGEIIGMLTLTTSLNALYIHLSWFGLIAAIAGVLALAGAYFLEKKLNLNLHDPLMRVNQLMREVIEQQDFSKRTKIDSNDEIGTLAKGLNDLIGMIEKRDHALTNALDKRIDAEKTLDKLAHYDNVTGLPNRHFFTGYLHEKLELSKANGLNLGIMFIDLDNFKIVNDTLGHLAGDQLLREASARIADVTPQYGKACRIGGDEFAIVLCDVQHIEEIDNIGKMLIEKLNQAFFIHNNEIFIGASIGISLFPKDANEFSSLLSSADAAMYHAKSLGKNNFQYYHPDMEGKIRRRLHMENSLRKAIEADELEVFYQPQVNIHTLEIQGFEALLRWNNPQMGVISPLEFIPIAEECGLIIPIGDWVLQTACYQTRIWQKTYRKNFRISVNFSAQQLQSDQMIEKILDALLTTGLPPNTLDIEITESSLMDKSEVSVQKMLELRSAGMHISIDDFGTGFSSLSYLKRFPLSALKIDRSFINDIPRDEDDVAITNAIIALSNTLGIEVIAEGVETREQLEYLRKNCKGQAQGYLFSPPISATAMEKLLQSLDASLQLHL